ncbi:MAG: trigger factor [Candidatus Omnitrophica bacterium]|nr:trigger factor [Candidatus Omnitrophota bacterium]
MAVTARLKEIAPCQKELHVEVPREEIEAEFEAVYRELKKNAFVPGFRVGFAPRDLLERYHGEKAKEEVLNRLVAHSLEEALKQQESLDLVGRPSVTDLQFDPKTKLSYSARLEVAPQVPLGRYKGLSLIRPKVKVTEEDLSRVLARMQESQAQLEPVLESRPAAEGDFLLANVTEQSPGKPPVKRRDLIIPLDLSKEKDPDGILKGLLGLTPGEGRSLPVKEGRTLTVELKTIKAKRLPALDDAFARSVGSFETLAALKQAIQESLQKEGEASQRQALESQAIHELLEGWNFDVPPSLVGSQAQRLLKERALELMNQGVPPSEVEERAKLLAEQAKLDALKQVKLFFILRRIAASEEISATAQEIEARLKALADRLKVSVEEVRKDLEARELLEELGWNIVRMKVFDLIIQEATINDRT